MAHELFAHDGLVLHKDKAWHGLGTIVENAPTPQEALQIAKLDWSVEQWPVYATNGESRLALADYQLNVRADIKHPLGMVGKGYTPIQNDELADFCHLLAEQGDEVKVESAGSIRNGAKVWFLLKGESFSVRGKDQVTPYILVSNGHDGGTALRCTPTTIRVVCSNTLHMVIPQFDVFDSARNGRAPKSAAYVAKHTGDVRRKVEDAKAALGLYGRALKQQQAVIDHLAARDVNSETVKRFLLECFARDFGAIAVNPATKQEQRHREEAMTGLRRMMRRFDEELNVGGATAWNAMNAYTGWLQHDKKIRCKNLLKAREKRIEGNLFGSNGEKTLEALGAALAL